MPPRQQDWRLGLGAAVCGWVFAGCRPRRRAEAVVHCRWDRSWHIPARQLVVAGFASVIVAETVAALKASSSQPFGMCDVHQGKEML